MQVRATDPACRTTRGDLLACSDHLAFPDIEDGKMRIKRVHAMPMIDDDNVPAAIQGDRTSL